MTNKHKTTSLIALALGLTLMSLTPAADSKTITTEDGLTVVNTQVIGKNIEGYQGPTPVKLYIKKDKVVRVEALPNHETPKYFARAKAVLKKFEGKSLKKVSSMKVDAVTGATYSSEALVRNVKKGVKYYNEHR